MQVPWLSSSSPQYFSRLASSTEAERRVRKMVNPALCEADESQA